jgi:hypothetical protein
LHGDSSFALALGNDVFACLHWAPFLFLATRELTQRAQKLQAVKPYVGVWKSAFGSVMNEENMHTVPRFGHGRLSDGHLKGYSAPACMQCGTPFTISHVVTWRLKARTVKQEEAATARQRHIKHVSAVTNQNATTEELPEAVSSMWSAPRLYSEDQREKSESSFQLAIMASRG